jgi:HlyD family secretion protein
MRFLLKLTIVLCLLAAGGYAAYRPLRAYWIRRNTPVFQFAEVQCGTLRSTVNATGTVKPRLSVQIGTFVSGPIIELNANFNDNVKKGDILARIDPAIYTANVDRDQAALDTRNAEVERVKALLQQAQRDEQRALMLFEENEDFISDAELDRLKYSRMSLQAQLTLSEAAVKQAIANLQNSQANLQYTEIKATQDGRVIDRKIEPGQTLAAQFQTPELFVLGVDMEKEMYVHASVDEADIGLIRKAQAEQQPVYFRVDAYPDELFEGRIKEIRMSSSEIQNVVTYPVVVTAPNPDLKLLPGMTANLTFQIEEKKDVIKIPWSAVRFFPKPEMVQEADRKLLEGTPGETTSNQQQPAADVTAEERVEASRKRLRRHVWILNGEKLQAREVLLGISDYRQAEMVEGDLQAGQKLVTDVQIGGRPG